MISTVSSHAEQDRLRNRHRLVRELRKGLEDSDHADSLHLSRRRILLCRLLGRDRAYQARIVPLEHQRRGLFRPLLDPIDEIVPGLNRFAFDREHEVAPLKACLFSR